MRPVDQLSPITVPGNETSTGPRQQWRGFVLDTPSGKHISVWAQQKRERRPIGRFAWSESEQESWPVYTLHN